MAQQAAPQVQHVSAARLDSRGEATVSDPTVSRTTDHGNSMFDPKPRLKQAQQMKRRSGLLRAFVGMQFMIRCKDGKNRQFLVRDIAMHREELPTAKAICLYCKQQWNSAQELSDAHPSDQEMIDRDEPHVFALWSDTHTDVPDGQARNEGHVIGLMSNEYAQKS